MTLKMFRRKQKQTRDNGNSYLYRDIPLVADRYLVEPIKTVVVDVSLMKSFYPRILLDGREKRGALINNLDGPKTIENFILKLPNEILYKHLKEIESVRINDPIYIGKANDFVLGIIDIVTYPFYFSLTHGINLNINERSSLIWKINSNILNHYCPLLRTLGCLLTISHFNENPIPGAPTHNLLVFYNKSRKDIEPGVKKFLKAAPCLFYVGKSNPTMADGYGKPET